MPKLQDLVEVRESPIHGKGVFAKRRLRAHCLVGVYEGERTSENDTYVLWFEDEGGQVVGIDGRNELRYVNHSSNPNTEFWGDQLFTLRTIQPGTELTFDYGEDWADTG